jgi:hypothetical protein
MTKKTHVDPKMDLDPKMDPDPKMDLDPQMDLDPKMDLTKAKEDRSTLALNGKQALQASLDALDASHPFERDLVRILFKTGDMIGVDLVPFKLVHTTSLNNNLRTFSLACTRSSLLLDKQGNLLPQILANPKMFLNWQKSNVKTSFLAEAIHILGHLKEYKEAMKKDKLDNATNHSEALLFWFKEKGLKTEKLSKRKLLTKPDLESKAFKDTFKSIEKDLSLLTPVFKAIEDKPIVKKTVETKITSSLLCGSCETVVTIKRRESVDKAIEPINCPICGIKMVPIVPKNGSAYVSLEKKLKALMK